MQELILQILAGPTEGTFRVPPGAPATLGRGATCEVCLLHPGVSRRHATVMQRDTSWYIIDNASTAGTFLNGVALPPTVATPVSGGDLLRVGPFTFRIGLGRAGSASTVHDTGRTNERVDRAVASTPFSMSDRRLRLLTECLTRLGRARDERSLAEAALDAALKGSGYGRGAVVRRVDGGAAIEVVATRTPDGTSPEDFRFSASLINAASAGETAVLTADATPAYGQSVAELRIHSALAAPVPLGDAVEACLYLDARENESNVNPEAAAFCEAVARAHGMALAELKRAELARRQAVLAAELERAREAQQVLLPPLSGEVGPVRYAMRMVPGVFVAGDLFDVLDLGGGRAAVLIGDVAGHGAGAAMIMAAAQSNLHANLIQTADPARAVTNLNAYLRGRTPPGVFLSLWVGVVSAAGDLAFVDAGHGYWLLGAPDRPAPWSGGGGGIPVGVEEDRVYHAQHTTLSPGSRLWLFSDGLVEQAGADGERFGRDRLIDALRREVDPDRQVELAFAALSDFSLTPALADDATLATVMIPV